MALAFVLDEHLRGPLWQAILRHNLTDRNIRSMPPVWVTRKNCRSHQRIWQFWHGRKASGGFSSPKIATRCSSICVAIWPLRTIRPESSLPGLVNRPDHSSNDRLRWSTQ